MALPTKPGVAPSILEQPPTVYSQPYMQRLVGELNARSVQPSTVRERVTSSTVDGTADPVWMYDKVVIIAAGTTSLQLPVSPDNEQQLYLINTTASSVSISGNGNSIWASGTTAATYTLPANTASLMIWDSVSAVPVWRVIK